MYTLAWRVVSLHQVASVVFAVCKVCIDAWDDTSADVMLPGGAAFASLRGLPHLAVCCTAVPRLLQECHSGFDGTVFWSECRLH